MCLGAFFFGLRPQWGHFATFRYAPAQVTALFLRTLNFRGAVLPALICAFYAVFLSVQAVDLGVILPLGEFKEGSRELADTYAAFVLCTTFLFMLGALVLTRFERRRAWVPMTYAGWLLITMVVNGAIHVAMWEGVDVSYALIAAFQLTCVAMDVLAAWLGGENFVSIRVFHRADRHRSSERRRHMDHCIQGT